MGGDLYGPPSNAGFNAMLAAYRPSGGTDRAEDLAKLLEERDRGNYVSLARLIASGRVFTFDWHGTCWIPMFQFDKHELTVKPAAREVLAELGRVYDGWSLACWFVQGNAWLQGQRPIDLLETDLPLVLNAARADRFLMAG